MSDYHQPLLPNETYHLFSRAVGSEKLFLCDTNYRYFLQKLKQHTHPVCRFYCYALLPNHFHLLVRIADDETVIKHFEIIKKKTFQPGQDLLSDFIMERFSNFLNSYSKAYNKMYQRQGALFMDYLKRSIVLTDSDLTSYTWYIHKNAVHHGITKKVGEWKYDSFAAMLSDAPTALLRNELLEWFGSKEAFIQFHQQTIYPKNITDV